MRIAEVLTQPVPITYAVERVGPDSDFEDCVDEHLWVRKKSFLKWFLKPENWFQKGGIAVRAYAGPDLIGIGVMNFDADRFRIWVLQSLDHDTQEMVGIVGFFVKEAYRRQGVAVRLAQELERNYAELHRRRSYRGMKQPAVACTGLAEPVARQAFRLLQVISPEREPQSIQMSF